MNSYNVNKIAGAVLWSALVIVGSKVLIEEISIPEHPEKPGYVVEIPGAEPGVNKETLAAKKAGGENAGAGAPTLGALLRTADVGRGAKIAKRCAGCHTFNKGGAPRTGPNLYGVVNRKIASTDGFSYSPAMKKKSGTWNFAELNCFLTNPRKCVSGTKMSFRGVKKPAQVADLLVYLNSLNDRPAALPK